MILLASLALAAPSFTDLGFVLRAPEIGPFVGGVNAPAVAWDGAQYVMYFESPGLPSDVPSDCATTFWIGRATSPDGLTWTFYDEPVLTPDRANIDSVYSCSVAQPAVLFDGETWHLFFAMGDQKISETSSTNNPAGIGYATSEDGIRFTVQEAPSALGDFDDGEAEWHAPEGGSQKLNLGMPTVTLVNRTLRLLYIVSTTQGGETTIAMHAAKYDLDLREWSIWDPAVSDAFTGAWAPEGLFSPSLACDQAAEGYEVVVGGYTEPTGVTRAAGLATSADLVDWDVGAPFTGEVFTSLNHLEALSAGPDRLVFYGAADPSTGHKAIGLAVTSTSYGTPDPVACAWDESVPETGDSGDADTDTDADTDADSDTDTDTDTDTDADTADTGGPSDDDGGCDCDSTGGAGGVFAVLGALALIRRRRG